MLLYLSRYNVNGIFGIIYWTYKKIYNYFVIFEVVVSNRSLFTS